MKNNSINYKVLISCAILTAVFASVVFLKFPGGTKPQHAELNATPAYGAEDKATKMESSAKNLTENTKSEAGSDESHTIIENSSNSESTDSKCSQDSAKNETQNSSEKISEDSENNKFIEVIEVGPDADAKHIPTWIRAAGLGTLFVVMCFSAIYLGKKLKEETQNADDKR